MINNTSLKLNLNFFALGLFEKQFHKIRQALHNCLDPSINILSNINYYRILFDFLQKLNDYLDTRTLLFLKF